MESSLANSDQAPLATSFCHPSPFSWTSIFYTEWRFAPTICYFVFFRVFRGSPREERFELHRNPITRTHSALRISRLSPGRDPTLGCPLCPPSPLVGHKPTGHPADGRRSPIPPFRGRPRVDHGSGYSALRDHASILDMGVPIPIRFAHAVVPVRHPDRAGPFTYISVEHAGGDGPTLDNGGPFGRRCVPMGTTFPRSARADYPRGPGFCGGSSGGGAAHFGRAAANDTNSRRERQREDRRNGESGP